jgi:tetratricopeptide (TPR) repeat protein
VTQLDPTHFNAFYARAACLNSLGKMEEAISDYEAALELDDGKGNELLNTIRSFSGAAESTFSMTKRTSPFNAHSNSFLTDSSKMLSSTSKSALFFKKSAKFSLNHEYDGNKQNI